MFVYGAGGGHEKAPSSGGSASVPLNMVAAGIVGVAVDIFCHTQACGQKERPSVPREWGLAACVGVWVCTRRKRARGRWAGFRRGPRISSLSSLSIFTMLLGGVLRALRPSSLSMSRQLASRAIPCPAALTTARTLFTTPVSYATSSAPVASEAAVAALPSRARFAIVQLGSSQYKVAQDDLICTEKIDLGVGQSLDAKRVLLVGDDGATLIGSPLIEGACVRMTVEEQGYGKKLVVFKKRRRKGYRRWRGFRSRLTLLRVGEIELPAALEEQMRDDSAGGSGAG
jgi:large subunit ribosomal protein L21